VDNTKKGMIDELGSDKLTFISLFILLSLFIFGLQIKTISSLFLLVALVVSLFIKNKKIELSLLFDMTLVFLFCFIYYSIMIEYRLTILSQEMILISLNFCIAYYLGAVLSRIYNNLFVALFIAILGCIIFSNLSVYNYILFNGGSVRADSILLDNRNVPSIWSSGDGGRVSATGIGLYLALGISLISCIYSTMNRLWKNCCITISLLSMVATLAIQSRTPLYTGIIIVVFSTLLYLTRTQLTKKSIMKVFFVSSLIIAASSIFASQLIEYITSSPLFRRQLESGVDDIRYRVWMVGIKGLFDYPLGGQKSDPMFAGYYHNLWLDIGWFGGILPVVILIIIQLKHVRYVFQAIFPLKSYLVLGILLSFAAGMMLEPVMQGYTNYLILSFFVFGYIKYYARRNISRSKSIHKIENKDWIEANGTQKSANNML